MNIPDVNVLIYAVNADAPQHTVARNWIEQAYAASDGIGLPWEVLLGFLRISTRRGILRSPLPIDAALGLVDDWLSHPAARIIAPTQRHAVVLGRLLLGSGERGPLVTDAHLAALAMEHGATLSSFDQDFDRFAGLRFEHLRG
jgi:toxin-antitoxin system PIN domain toxin